MIHDSIPFEAWDDFIDATEFAAACGGQADGAVFTPTSGSLGHTANRTDGER
jgi:hypothetical protein